MTIRVLLVDDQPLLRHGFRLVLAAEPDLEVVGEAGSGDEAVRLVGVLHPDIVLMDVRMPGMDGIEATRLIAEQAPAVRTIILTTYDVDQYAFSGLRAGASGFLLKDVQSADLVDAIRVVARGDAVVAPSTTRRLLTAFAHRIPADDAAATEPPDVLAPLTDRERGVFAGLATGLTNAEIAQGLSLSDATVKTHVGHILAKLELRDRIQAVIFAYENGLNAPRV
ncbi:MAG: DNA-binding response regulator [Marmoricola sp.]|nr:DNA-binding response regulator [Marmoricola sp.]